MSEKFDFSKIEDRDKFEKLSKEEQDKIGDEAQSEALEMNEGLKNTFGMAPQEWKDFFIVFGDLRKEVLEKIFSLDDKKQDLYLKRIKDKQNKAFSSVSDPGKYLAYHKSIASGTGPVYSPKLDFEGEHSLLKFYRKLLVELSSEINK